jgi:hypothetical protein
LTEETNCGIPDILFIHNGVTIFLEVKSQRGRLKPIQKATLRQLQENGVIAEVVRSVEDAAVVLHLQKANLT